MDKNIPVKRLKLVDREKKKSLGKVQNIYMACVHKPTQVLCGEREYEESFSAHNHEKGLQHVVLRNPSLPSN